MSITVNMSTVKNPLAELPEQMLDYAYEVMMEQAHLIVALAQIYVPVDTGSLRDSIRVERGGEGKNWRQVKVRAGGYITNPETGKKVYYARYQEEGTRYIAARRFIGQAVDEVKPTIKEMVKAKVVEQVQSHVS